jgi:hypothetical protein
MHITRLTAFVLAQCLAAGVYAAAPALPAADVGAPAPAPTPETAASAVVDRLDSSRAAVRSSSEWLARKVDSWFGDKPFLPGGGVSDGELSLNMMHRQNEGSGFNVGFNARFHLPNVENRSYLFIGRDNPDEVVADTPKPFSRQERLLTTPAEPRSFFVGLGIALREALELRVGVRGGLKPYAQARYRRGWQLGASDRIDFRQTLFWTMQDQIGSTTALGYTHKVTNTLTLRWLNAATITQETKTLNWSSGAELAKTLGEQRLLSFDALVSGQNHANLPVSEYGVQAKWQQPVYRPWLVGHVIVGHFWPRTDELSLRERRWALGGGVKMLF